MPRHDEEPPATASRAQRSAGSPVAKGTVEHPLDPRSEDTALNMATIGYLQRVSGNASVCSLINAQRHSLDTDVIGLHGSNRINSGAAPLATKDEVADGYLGKVGGICEDVVPVSGVVASSPAVQRESDDSKSAEPPEHRVIHRDHHTMTVLLEDVNYSDEKLGSWICSMDVVKTASGQVYPLIVDLIPKINHPASKCISYGADVKSLSVNESGERYAEIHFSVRVAGPNECSTESTSLGGKVGWEEKASGLKAEGQVGWSHSTSYSGQSAGTWARAYRATATTSGVVWTELTDHRVDLVGDPPQVVIDDEAGHDMWGIDADWWLQTR